MTLIPDDMGKFELVRLSTLRAKQLILGCTPRVASSSKRTTIARLEVLEGKVIGLPRTPVEPR